MEKIESDGNISLIGKTFEHIFDKEIIYAVSELKKLRKKQQGLDLKSHFLKNTQIFKENLKLITCSIIESLWRERVKEDQI